MVLTIQSVDGVLFEMSGDSDAWDITAVSEKQACSI